MAKQIPAEKAAAHLFARMVEEQIPNPTGVATWTAFLRAHASLMRRLDADLRSETGAGLNEFDVLATLAIAGGSLRMTELAERAYSSRSGMTRRVDQLLDEGLLSRRSHHADGRAVVVGLTAAGVKRLRKLAPAHLRGVQMLFVSRFNAKELNALLRALAKITPETTFG